MVHLSAVLFMRKCPKPPKIYKRMETFRINFNKQGRARNCFRLAIRTQMKALQYSRISNQQKPYDMKELYTTRLEAATEEHGIPFEYFWKALRSMDVALNRKVLADIAIHEPRSFSSFCELAKNHHVEQGLNLPPHSHPKIPVITRGMKYTNSTL